MNRYASLISTGTLRPLDTIAFHDRAPLERRLMAGAGLLAASDRHVAIHDVRALGREERRYCEPHRHSCAELNLLVSADRLLYRIQLEDETYEVAAPAMVFVPPGILHSANVIEGTGFFIAVLDAADYEASLVRGAPTLPRAGPGDA